MESEERREARPSQSRDCRKCCSIESAEQREVQFSKQRERDKTQRTTQFTAQWEGLAAAKTASGSGMQRRDRRWHLRL